MSARIPFSIAVALRFATTTAAAAQQTAPAKADTATSARAQATSSSKPDTAATPHKHDMAGMAGMAGMSMPIVIPKGAIYTEADVHFMQGMIAHHAQAIYMSRMAAGRNASPRVLRFANKIDQSQAAEIRLMQDWLVANKQAAPDTGSWRTMSMPGMLTTAQLAQLDAAKGTDFDATFLNLMIQHHTGALKMVADLLATPMAAQDVDVSVFANDVVTVQTAEIGLMQQMLANL
ncbi:hypothetical protein BH09GEM1_BH09GEM1_32760 [soil metagenome]